MLFDDIQKNECYENRLLNKYRNSNIISFRLSILYLIALVYYILSEMNFEKERTNMEQQERQKSLLTIIDTLRDYGQRLTEGLSSEDLNWTPKETKGKSILEIFRHILEGELYWLDFIGHKTPKTLDQLPSLDSTELLDLYLSLQSFLKKLVKQSMDTDLVPKDPKEGATLAWVIWHTSFHTIHHLAQVGYLRYANENPPDSEAVNTSWDNTMDSLINLGM